MAATESASGSAPALARLQALFAEALSLSLADQRALLNSVRAEDPALHRELEALLDLDARLEGSATLQPMAELPEWAYSTAALNGLEGQRIGAYQLLELLGQGGMGSVYRARRVDGSVEQEVAIKLVRPEVLGPLTRQRFQLERQTLARLDHPNIARLLDAAERPDGSPYFVMEYVQGVPITRHCAELGLPLDARLHLFLRVCAAVSHAHRKLVVHRDLKPGNILVSDHSEPKLLDFGIAKSLQEDMGNPAQTGTEQSFFSPAYAAPEQLLGEPVSVGCDIYALGLLLYELLAGVGPFDLSGLRLSQIEQQVIGVPAPAPSTRCLGPAHGHRIQARQLRGDLDAIVLRCLRKAPAERYRSVEQLEADLQAFLQGRPVSASPGQGVYRLRKFIERNRWNVAAGAVLLLVLLSATAALLRQNRALQQERDLSQQALRLLQDSFASADPLRTAGADIRAADILDTARQRLEPLRDAQPELYLALAPTIADVDLSVARYREAVQLYEHSEALADSRGSKLDAQQRIRHARALIGLNLTGAARVQLERAWTEFPSLARDSEWGLAMSGVLAREDRLPAAIAMLEALLQRSDSAPAMDPMHTEIALGLAELHRQNAALEAALAQIDQLLQRQSLTLAADHPQRLRARMRRVTLLRQLGQHPAAMLEAQAVAGEIDRVFGSESPDAAYAQASLGISLKAAGRNGDAIAAYRRALKIWQRAVGPDHPNTLRSQFNLANALRADPTRYREVRTLYQEVLDRSEANNGRQHLMSVFYRLQFGQYLWESTQRNESLQVLLLDGPELLTHAHADTARSYREGLGSLRSELRCTPDHPGYLTELQALWHCQALNRWFAADRLPAPTRHLSIR